MVDNLFWSWAMIVMFFTILGAYFYIMIFSKSARARREKFKRMQNQGVQWKPGEQAPEPFPNRARRFVTNRQPAEDDLQPLPTPKG